jgi:hypothetical protein
MNFRFYFIKFLFIFIYLISKNNSIDLLGSKFVLNINGNSHYLNYYYTTLFYGNKKENQTFLLDTTSSVTTSPCTLCPSCGDHVNDYFEIKSNTSIIKSESYTCSSLPYVIYSGQQNINNNNNNNEYNKDYCRFLYNFDQNTKVLGFYLNNLISFEPITSKNNSEESEEEYISGKAEFEMPIGCTMNETGEYQSRVADGVMGLNRNDKSFISMLYSMKIIKSNIFSLCLDEYGGYFSLGEIDTKYHIDRNISYVNIFSYNELYQLEIKNIFIGETEINNIYLSTIDSSSTISYFPKDIFNSMMAGIFAECLDKNGQCGKIKRMEGYGICSEFMDLKEMKKALNGIWPTIKIIFNGYEFIWEPRNYYIDHSSETKYRACFGFDTDEKMNSIILGTNFMRGYDIIFDRENNRIGFAMAECGRNMRKKLQMINEIKVNITKTNENINIIKEKSKEKSENITYEIKENITKEKNINNGNNNINEFKSKFNEKNDPNNYKEKVYLLLFVIFVIFIIITIINYVKCDNESNNSNDDNLQEKYENVINEKEEKEEKDINKIKPLGQMIEMI